MNGPYNGLPPLYITASQIELLYSDAVTIAERAKKAGVDVHFEAATHGVHDYPLFGDFAPEYHASFCKLCAFIRTTASDEDTLTT